MLLRIPYLYKMASAPHCLDLSFAICGISLRPSHIPSIVFFQILIAALTPRLPPTCARQQQSTTAAAVHPPKTGLHVQPFTKARNVLAKKKPMKKSRKHAKNVKQKPNSWKNPFKRSPRMRSSHLSQNQTLQLGQRTKVRSSTSLRSCVGKSAIVNAPP